MHWYCVFVREMAVSGKEVSVEGEATVCFSIPYRLKNDSFGKKVRINHVIRSLKFELASRFTKYFLIEIFFTVFFNFQPPKTLTRLLVLEKCPAHIPGISIL